MNRHSYAVPNATGTVVNGLGVDPVGNIWVVGSATLNGGSHAFDARLTAGGALDPTYGQNGFDTYADKTILETVDVSGKPAVLAGDRNLKPEAWAPHNYRGSCCVANSAILYQKVT